MPTPPPPPLANEEPDIWEMKESCRRSREIQEETTTPAWNAINKKTTRESPATAQYSNLKIKVKQKEGGAQDGRGGKRAVGGTRRC